MPINFLIVGTQRTGTQALFHAFNLHPDVVCGGEWTQDVPWYGKVGVASQALSGDLSEVVGRRPIDEMQRAQDFAAQAGWLGFKILFRSSDKWVAHPRLSPALFLDRLEAHLAWLRSNRETRVIQVVRRDGIDWLKSKYLARATGTFTHSHYPENAKITVPVDKALKALEAKNWVDQRLATLAQSNPYHRVIYEDFATDNRRGLEACLAFLGCDVSKLQADGRFIEKQSSQSAASYIRNFEELATAVEARQLRASALLS